MLRLSDFYAGVGGISRGFEQTGRFQTNYAVDFDPWCKITYDLNNETKLTTADINTLNPQTVPPMDILTAGFNCQPFSVAGERKGFDDQRTDSIQKVFDIIRSHQPLVVFFENVKGLLTHNDGASLQRINNMFSIAGYGLSNNRFVVPLNTCRYSDRPQNRERIFIIAFRFDIDSAESDRLFRFDEVVPTPLSSLLDAQTPVKYHYTVESPIYTRLAQSVIDPAVVYQYRRGIVRANQSGVCPALVATMGTGGHNVPIIRQGDVIRKLTPRECFRLQGFDDTFQLPAIADSHLYKQAGNSVTVPIIRLVADEIVRVLQSHGHLS